MTVTELKPYFNYHMTGLQIYLRVIQLSRKSKSGMSAINQPSAIKQIATGVNAIDIPDRPLRSKSS